MSPLYPRIRLWLCHPITSVVFGLIPCLFCLIATLTQLRQHEALKQKICVLQMKDRLSQERAEEAKALAQKLKDADPDYIQNSLEKRVFLEGEIHKLETALLTEEAKGVDQFRLHFLKDGANRLKLCEKRFQRIGHWQEVDIAQELPVELSSQDLQELLAILECVQIDSYPCDRRAPAFLIDNFELTRKLQPSQEETFSMKLHAIKREYIDE